MLLWSDRYRVGLKEIDAQHKALIEQYNEVYELGVDPQDGLADMFSAYDQLLFLIKVHFCVEECLLRIVAYPGRREHLRNHRKILEQLLHERRLFVRNPDRADINRTLSRLYDCLIEHVQESDRDYVAHLRRHGIR